MRLWDVQTGRPLFVWETHQPARACRFGTIDPHTAMYTTDSFSTSKPSIRFVRIADIPEESSDQPMLQIDLERQQRCVATLGGLATVSARRPHRCRRGV